MNMNDIFRNVLQESFFKAADFDKDNFKYLRKILGELESENIIYIKQDETSIMKVDITDLKKDDNFINIKNMFQNWLNGNGSITFIVKSKNGMDKKEIKSLDEYYSNKKDYKKHLINLFNSMFGENYDIQWNNIVKTFPKYISTPEQESIQAIFLASVIQGDNNFKDVDVLFNPDNANEGSENFGTYVKIINNLYNNEYGFHLSNHNIDFKDKKNIEVLKKLANVLNIKLPEEISKLKETGFTIIHPDGLVTSPIEVGGEMIDINCAKVLFGEGVTWEKIFMDGKKYDTLSKDIFIPADIYIIPKKSAKTLKELIEGAGGNFSPNSIVGFSNKLMRSDLIYPISLKMSDTTPTFHKIENSKEGQQFIEVGIKNIENIYFNQTGNSSMEIKCGDDILVLSFRTKGEGKSWQCNAMNKKNKNAIEGGSAKENMKLIFNDSMEGSITIEEAERITDIFDGKIKINTKLNVKEQSKQTTLADSFRKFFEDDTDIEVDFYVKKRSSVLNESFRKFFEDDEDNDDEKENKSTSKITARDMVLLAVPGTAAHNNIKTPSAKEGCIGLGLVCKKLIDNDIEKNYDYNEALSQIVQLSYKLSKWVQDTWKIM